MSPQPHFLTEEQINDALNSFKPGAILTVHRIRYKNKDEIRTLNEMSVEQFREFVRECIENGRQPGGDLELHIPALKKTLIGHHDGVYWLESIGKAIIQPPDVLPTKI